MSATAITTRSAAFQTPNVLAGLSEQLSQTASNQQEEAMQALIGLTQQIIAEYAKQNPLAGNSALLQQLGQLAQKPSDEESPGAQPGEAAPQGGGTAAGADAASSKGSQDSGVTIDGKQVSNDELKKEREETMKTLGKNESFFANNANRDEINKWIDHPDTSPEMNKALKHLRDDPELFDKLDSGGGGEKDGGISCDNLNGAQGSAEFKSMSSGVNIDGKELSNEAVDGERKETVAILGRHEEIFEDKPNREDLQAKLDDPNTPPDLKRALKHLLNDGELFGKLDGADDDGNHDGHISKDDLNVVQNEPEQKAYNEKKSEAGTHNYIPSDNEDKNVKPREMTAKDAKHELFRYSDNIEIHGDITLDTLRAIADGSLAMNKAPIQLQAAAKYYVDHPDEFERDLGGGDGHVSKSDMLGEISKEKITKKEAETLDTVAANKDVFFGGESLTRSKLEDIKKDPNSKPDCKKAAEELLNNDDLYTKLDNAKRGYDGSAIYKADDQKISEGDFDAFNKNRPEVETEKPKAKTKPALQDKAAQRDMAEGLQNQPNIKEGKGGFLQDVGSFLTKAGSVLLNIGSTILSGIAALKIPGISQVAALGSVAAAGGAGALNVAHTAIEGGNVKQAGIDAGVSTAGAAFSSIVAPGAGQAVTKGFAAAGGKALGQAGGKAAVTEAGKGAGEAGGTAAATNAAAKAGWRGEAVSGGSNVTKGELADTAAKKAGEGTATQAGLGAYKESMDGHSAGVAVRTKGDSVGLGQEQQQQG
jgi:type III secretion translocon protein HrpF